MDTEMTEAGPSRPRRSSPPSTPRQTSTDNDNTGTDQASASGDSTSASASRREPSRPASPETAFASRHSRAGSTVTAAAAADPSPEPDSSPGAGSAQPPSAPHLDLASYPTSTLLRLIANLLQQIASANDQIRSEPEDTDEDGSIADNHSHAQSSGGEGRSRSGSRASSSAPVNANTASLPSPTAALFSNQSEGSNPSDRPPGQNSGSGGRSNGGIDPSSPLPLFTASRTSLVHPSSLLSFHARHVPSISIEAYLLRILKDCPTTNEVFLSLLVYFDRMSRLGTATGVGAGLVVRNGKGFAIDSYNVHRLVIAGVTVASKFFSDVFYTNSRYAKVGGLPPHELNQLELQFLLLNDFRLAVPTEEMQRYGDRLLGYWEGREEETGVDVETGRELSENGRRRAREKRERKEEAERLAQGSAGIGPNGQIGDGGSGTKGEGGDSGAGPSEEDVNRAIGEAASSSATAAVSSALDGEKMEVDPDTAPNGVISASRPPDPAQPPPEPAETASAPVTPADVEDTPMADGSGASDSADGITGQPAPPRHSAPNPPASVPPTSSTRETSLEDGRRDGGIETESSGSAIRPVQSPTEDGPISNSQPQGTRKLSISGSGQKHGQDATGSQRSLSFSRPTSGRGGPVAVDGVSNGISLGWAKGDQAVCVSGTG